MRITVTIHFPTGVNFWIIEGDNLTQCVEYAKAETDRIGGTIGAYGITCDEDMKAWHKEVEHPPTMRNYKQWYFKHVPTTPA
jgi:hypothetical protein